MLVVESKYGLVDVFGSVKECLNHRCALNNDLEGVVGGLLVSVLGHGFEGVC